MRFKSLYCLDHVSRVVALDFYFLSLSALSYFYTHLRSDLEAQLVRLPSSYHHVTTYDSASYH